MKLERGTQVVYVPRHLMTLDPHVLQNYHYPHGLQPGFITSGPNNNGDYFVRYWYVEKGLTKMVDGKLRANIPEDWELRTKANSEATSPDMLVIFNTVSQQKVEHALKEFC